jgi:hypothetical protein
MNIKLKIIKKGKHVMVASTPPTHLFYFSLDTNFFPLLFCQYFNNKYEFHLERRSYVQENI